MTVRNVGASCLAIHARRTHLYLSCRLGPRSPAAPEVALARPHLHVLAPGLLEPTKNSVSLSMSLKIHGHSVALVSVEARLVVVLHLPRVHHLLPPERQIDVRFVDARPVHRSTGDGVCQAAE